MSFGSRERDDYSTEDEILLVTRPVFHQSCPPPVPSITCPTPTSPFRHLFCPPPVLFTTYPVHHLPWSPLVLSTICRVHHQSCPLPVPDTIRPRVHGRQTSSGPKSLSSHSQDLLYGRLECTARGDKRVRRETHGVTVGFPTLGPQNPNQLTKSRVQKPLPVPSLGRIKDTQPETVLTCPQKRDP